ncbi:unnamed protein product, partial [marine sediment metagenome]
LDALTRPTPKSSIIRRSNERLSRRLDSAHVCATVRFIA